MSTGRSPVAPPGYPGPTGLRPEPLRGPSGQPGQEELRLPKPPGFIRMFWLRNPWILDGLTLAIYFYPAVLAQVATGQTNPGGLAGVVLGINISLIVSAGLLFRRFVPLWLAGAASFAVLTSSSQLLAVNAIAVLFALYAVAVYHSVKAAWIWAAIATGATVVNSILLTVTDPASVVGSSLLYGMLYLVALLFGITFGNRKRYIAALVDRAAQLARERDQQAQLATASERARIAREMHDIVAHSLTVMIALADGAGAVAVSNPERAAGAMTNVAEIGRKSLADMRHVLGVLNDASGTKAGEPAGGDSAGQAGAAPLTPQPGSAELPLLIESYRAAGLPLALTVRGDWPPDQLMQLTLYRVVQESLTNALRYAREPTRVDVVLDFLEPGLATVTVTDDGFGYVPGEVRPSLGTGRGLIGMRERVNVYQGTVEAGPVSPRGWRIRAGLRTEEGSRP